MSPTTIERVGRVAARVGEGAVWDVADQALWWVDIPAGLIHRHAPSDQDRSWQIGEAVGCLARRDSGGLVLAARSGFHFFEPETDSCARIADPEAGCPDSRFNDGTTDPRGRFWAGTMTDRGQPRPVSSLWRLDPDLTVTRGWSGLSTTNGLAFSPDGRRIYFSDSHPSARMIWQADYDLETGGFGPLRNFVMSASNHPNHPTLARWLQVYLHWRNPNARHPDVLAAQRRERARVRSERQQRWGRPAAA